MTVEIRLADLGRAPDPFDNDHRLKAPDWPRIVQVLRSLNLLEPETLDRLAFPAARVEVSRAQARKIGQGLERWMIDEWVKTATPPVLPSCIVPIATSNGLWIDPALPLLNRKQDSHGEIFWFAAFCMNCKGFSVN